MIMRIVKFTAVGVLLLAAMFWSSAPGYQTTVNAVVSAAAVMVVAQSVRMREYGWAFGFTVLALLFNPAWPIFDFAGPLNLVLVLVCIAPFAVSLSALKSPRVSQVRA